MNYCPIRGIIIHVNRLDYDKLMQTEIKTLAGRRTKILLHSCCAPCSSACLERLKESFDITVLYYNPNIGEEEYIRRKLEQIRLLESTGWADFLDCDHDEDEFYSLCSGMESEHEGGMRCKKCYTLRIERTAEEASMRGFEYFTSTLTVSPLKSAKVINEIGERAAIGKRSKWLYSDFKKRNGYLRSCELSKEYSLYRQSFCGCEFSKNAAKSAGAIQI